MPRKSTWRIATGETAIWSAVTRHLKETQPRRARPTFEASNGITSTACAARRNRRWRAHRVWSTSVAYSRDGRRLASASGPNPQTLGYQHWPARPQLRDERAGRLRGRVPPGRHRLASAGSRTCRSHSGTRQPVSLSVPSPGHTKDIRELAISRDGKILASSSTDGTVKFWDIATGSLIRTIPGSRRRASSVRSPSAPTARPSPRPAAASEPSRIWDVAKGSLVRTLENTWSAPGANLTTSPPAKPLAAPAQHRPHSRGCPSCSPGRQDARLRREDGTIRLWIRRRLAGSQASGTITTGTPSSIWRFPPTARPSPSISHMGRTVYLWDGHRIHAAHHQGA